MLSLKLFLLVGRSLLFESFYNEILERLVEIHMIYTIRSQNFMPVELSMLAFNEDWTCSLCYEDNKWLALVRDSHTGCSSNITRYSSFHLFESLSRGVLTCFLCALVTAVGDGSWEFLCHHH